MLELNIAMQIPSKSLRRAFEGVRGILFVSVLGLMVFGVSILLWPSTRDRHVPHLRERRLPTGRIPSPLKNNAPLDIPSLINVIRETNKVAAGGLNDTQIFPASEMEAWHRNNPCQSRKELHSMYALRRRSKDINPNPEWVAVLKEYEKLHRTCIRKVGDVTEFFLNKQSIPGCQFVVADTEWGTGLGNNLLGVVSVILYAVLTQRVVLVPVSTGIATSIPSIMCEPFEGSSWRVDPQGLFTPAKSYPRLWTDVGQFYGQIIDVPKKLTDNIKSIHAGRVIEDWECQPQPRFFCDTEQAYYTRVPWLYFRECLYFLPKLFAIPSFRPVLEALFPDRWALPHLLRSVMLPGDPVWDRVKQLNDERLQHADHRVGIQVRYFHGRDDFNFLHEPTNAAVEQCLQDRLSPFNPTREESADQESNNRVGINATVFITSLYSSLHDRLLSTYGRNAIEIIQLSHHGTQYYSVEEDRQALTEILGLSLSDDLILTPQSTFGALAQGYGAVTPWFIDIRLETSTPCVQGQTAEICYQIPNAKYYSCPHDVEVDGKNISDVVPYISDCHLIEKPLALVNGAGLGLQLITS